MKLQFPVATDETKARLLGMASQHPNLKWSKVSEEGKDLPRQEKRKLGTGAGLEIDLPAVNPSTIPCQHAWVVALTGIANVK